MFGIVVCGTVADNAGVDDPDLPIFTNPFAFKCFLVVSPVVVIGTYAAFVVRMVRREVALPHYKVTFTGGKWRTGAEMSVRYEFAGASAPDALKVHLVQSST